MFQVNPFLVILNRCRIVTQLKSPHHLFLQILLEHTCSYVLFKYQLIKMKYTFLYYHEEQKSQDRVLLPEPKCRLLLPMPWQDFFPESKSSIRYRFECSKIFLIKQTTQITACVSFLTISIYIYSLFTAGHYTPGLSLSQAHQLSYVTFLLMAISAEAIAMCIYIIRLTIAFAQPTYTAYSQHNRNGIIRF